MAKTFKPYLLRAMHQFITDKDGVPYIVVDCAVPGVNVPAAYIKDNQVVLNVSYSAASSLFIGNNTLEFSARFGSLMQQISVPIAAVKVVYNRDDLSEGVAFEANASDNLKTANDESAEGSETKEPDAKPKVTAPFLRVVQ